MPGVARFAELRSADPITPLVKRQIKEKPFTARSGGLLSHRWVDCHLEQGRPSSDSVVATMKSQEPAPIRRRPAYAGLLLLGASIALAAAAAFPVDLQKAAEEVRDRELAFSARAGEVNVRDAFLEFFAADGIGFKPEPYVSPPDYADDPPWPVDLQWWPAEVGVSADGRMGYSTGPVERRRQRSDPEPRSHGTYTSVWKKNDQGVWQVAADIGSSPPQATGQRGDPVVFRLPEAGAPPAPKGSLLAADRVYAEAAGMEPQVALRAVAAPTYRLHLPDQAPKIGVDEASPFWTGPCRFTPGQENVAASGDFGFTTGTGAGCYRTAGAAESFGYLRIWRVDAKGHWRLMVEAINVAPPKG